MAGGRPSKYKPEFAELAKKFCLLGATNEDLARSLEVSLFSIKHWMKKNPDFSTAIKEGRTFADANVANSLYRRACGYSHPEDKIFVVDGEPLIVPTVKHYPPDTAAAFIWLKNRAGWRDKVDHNVNSQSHNSITITALDDNGKKLERV